MFFLWPQFARRLSSPIAIPLSNHEVWGGSAQIQQPSGSLVCTTPPETWNNNVAFTVKVPRVSLVREKTFALRIEAEALHGKLSFLCVDGRDRSTPWSGRANLLSHAGRGTIHLILEDVQADPILLVQNIHDGESRGIIHKIEVLPLSALRPAEIKRARSQRHGYWHYSYDLGDGVRVEATLSGGMQAHLLNRDIMFGMIEEFFGGPNGKRIVDVACSSGFHSFELASHGARVDAFDIDPSQIDQAKLVKSCQSDRHRNVTFECADLLKVAVPAQPYDLGYCSGLFYHLRDLVGGAQKLYDLTTTGAVVHSCVSALPGEVMELADSKKFICCFDGEFSFVPTPQMLKRIFEYVGFKEVHCFRSEDRVASQRVDELAPQYRNIYRHHTAYYALKK